MTVVSLHTINRGGFAGIENDARVLPGPPSHRWILTMSGLFGAHSMRTCVRYCQMFTALAEAIEEVEIGADPDALAAVLVLRSRLDARVSAAVAAVDASRLWEVDGATSMTAWLADRGGLARRRAAREVREARLVARLPATAAAWADGTLPGGHVEAVCANLDDYLVGVFAHHEAGVMPALADLPVADCATAMQAWRAQAEDREPPPERPQTLHASRLPDGHMAVDGNLDGETGELLITALRLAGSPDAPGEPPRTLAARRADALGDVCRFFLDHQTRRIGGRHRPHLNLVLDLEDHGGIRRAATVDGHHLDTATAERLLCDGVVHRVITQGRSAILDYGRASRIVPPALWTVIALRDRHCRFPGCDRTPQWCEAHHVRPWQDGGATERQNLVLLCARHHHLLHRSGWRIKLLPDATVEVTDPRGHTRTSIPPATCPPCHSPPRQE